jgi:hypothetical protein
MQAFLHMPGFSALPAPHPAALELGLVDGQPRRYVSSPYLRPPLLNMRQSTGLTITKARLEKVSRTITVHPLEEDALFATGWLGSPPPLVLYAQSSRYEAGKKEFVGAGPWEYGAVEAKWRSRQFSNSNFKTRTGISSFSAASPQSSPEYSPCKLRKRADYVHTIM